MIRKVKALTLALVAVCAIGVVGASGASAAEFHIAGMGAATGDGTQIAGSPVEFVIPEGTVKCADAAATVQLLTVASVPVETTGPTATVKLHEPKHTPINEQLTCTFAGLAGSVTQMNGCDFLFHAGPPIQADVVCPAGQQIVITSTVTGVLKCTVKVGAQTGKQGFTITNGAEDITLENASKNINYTTTAGTGLGACTTTAAGTGAEFKGKATVQGTAGGVASKLQYA